MPLPSDWVQLRKGRAVDAPVIAALLREMVDELGGALDHVSTEADILSHGFGPDRQFHVVLAEDAGTPVGMVIYFFNYSTWTARLGVYVQDIHISRSKRGTGLGRRLIAAAARAGKQKGATHLRLSVEPDNEAAQRFYLQLGLAQRTDELIFQTSRRVFDDLSAGGEHV